MVPGVADDPAPVFVGVGNAMCPAMDLAIDLAMDLERNLEQER